MKEITSTRSVEMRRAITYPSNQTSQFSTGRWQSKQKIS